jgi:Trk K+ transport system NAD-binding subunit
VNDEERVLVLGNADVGGSIADLLTEQASLTVVMPDEACARTIRRVDADACVDPITTGGHGEDLAEIGANVTIDVVGLLIRTTTEDAIGGMTGSV